ncbi:hypothetical protein [Methylobacterium bullatum]|uniref:Uncharacterized protein n=1 Tax=Methylobacterium bullatum TaxID=570505 RepID=A0AAV4Z865_9HYPH|nr:hypothetical protein [Methylobacterium bullatum]MBD8901396.1 hypothetical protein [Methylobacterium bullatum]GJD40091.1 hypothetical protein OICFNHDK_2556 [Methylobacterium bullatum]
MSKPVSGNKLAAILGVSQTAVRNALKGNRIKRLPGGLIDPVAAREDWAATTDPSRSKVRTSGKVRTQGAQVGAQVRTEAEAREAVTLISRILAEEGMRDDGKGIDFGKVRTAELILKARQRHLDQAEQEGTLVDRAAAEKLFFDLAREGRDAWLSWPARVGIPMAEEIKIDPTTGKVDPRSLVTVLSSYVRQHLAEMGEPSDPEWKKPK